MLNVVVFPHQRFFIFVHCFLITRKLLPGLLLRIYPFNTLSTTHCRVICNTFILTFLGFSITASAKVLRRCFLPPYVFYIALLPKFWCICALDECKKTLSRILLYAYLSIDLLLLTSTCFWTTDVLVTNILDNKAC